MINYYSFHKLFITIHLKLVWKYIEKLVFSLLYTHIYIYTLRSQLSYINYFWSSYYKQLNSKIVSKNKCII